MSALQGNVSCPNVLRLRICEGLRISEARPHCQLPESRQLPDHWPSLVAYPRTLVSKLEGPASKVEVK